MERVGGGKQGLGSLGAWGPGFPRWEGRARVTSRTAPAAGSRRLTPVRFDERRDTVRRRYPRDLNIRGSFRDSGGTGLVKA